VVIPACEAVRLVTDRLAEPESSVVAGQTDRLALPLDVDQLLLLREADHHGRAVGELRQRLERRMELAEASVDEQHVRQQFPVLLRILPSPGDHLADRTVVVVSRCRDPVAAVRILEWLAVDEADLARHRLLATEVRDVDRFHAADRPVHSERALQAARTHRRITREHHELGLPVVLLAAPGLAIVEL
jgi:hypothetical protein